LPGVDLRVMSDRAADAAKECATDEIGGIEVRGPNVFSGYWRMPEKTKEEFSTGSSGEPWFKTGDVGKVDASGVVTIVGRSKDLIITGGYNVYPAEIEGYLNDMPGVAESAVIGVPHADFGEAVLAVVVARAGAAPDAAAMVSALKARIANFKVPKRVFVVTELPRNAMGKVLKNLLRDEHKALFSGS
jgi:malonyl-CoA/methylmalonyl-CoA synthetase